MTDSKTHVQSDYPKTSFLSEREAGILMHVTSLPGGQGIGDFGLCSYAFVDWMVQAGLSIWQMLPLVPPGKEDSPYSTWSSLALGSLFVDLRELEEASLLGADRIEDAPKNSGRVDYLAVNAFKRQCLQEAFGVFKKESKHPWQAAWKDFCREQSWAENVGLYRALREDRKTDWFEWPVHDRKPTVSRLSELRSVWKAEIELFTFEQFVAWRQLANLRIYANRQGIRLVGDLPIYVDHGSVDVWLNQDLFELDDKGYPLQVSGVPPDAFTADGQLWRHPLYNWASHARENYHWWTTRLQQCLKQTDIVRIDHFRGFSAYWSVPADHGNAVHGQWRKGPGYDLFSAMESAIGKPLPVIAEDLGFIDAPVHELKEKSGLPGMCILEFGFGDGEDGPVHHPDNHPVFSVVYTGTHDNEPLVQWRSRMSAKDKMGLAQCFSHGSLSDYDFVWSFIDLAFSSRALLTVVPTQDFLALGAAARMNEPGTTAASNWVWRASGSDLTMALAAKVRASVEKSGRWKGKPQVNRDPV